MSVSDSLYKGSISGVLALQYSVNLTQISGTDVMEKLPLGDT